MVRWLVALGLFAIVVFSGPQPGAETARSAWLIGHWECAVDNAADLPFQRVTFDYEANNSVAMRFYAVTNKGAVTMTMTANAAWTYDDAPSAYSQTISSARVDDIIVNGTPMARSQFPTGENGLIALEQNFVAQYGNASLNVRSLEERALTLVDGGGVTINCTR